MTKKILSISSEIRKTNSSNGRYSVLCNTEFTYDNGYKRIMDEFQLFWTVKEAKNFINTTTL